MELEPYKIRASKIGAALCLQGSEVAKVEKGRGDDKKKKRGEGVVESGEILSAFLFLFFFSFIARSHESSPRALVISAAFLHACVRRGESGAEVRRAISMKCAPRLRGRGGMRL